MHLKRFLFCVLFVAIVCTPLTAMNTNRNRRQHQTQRKTRPAELNQHQIIERNRTKNTMILESRDDANENDLPLVRYRPVQPSDTLQGLYSRSPRVDDMVIRELHLNMNTSEGNEYSSGKCGRSTDYKKQFQCKPRDTVVHLIHLQDLILSPNAVVVKRCDGMCVVHSKCIPTERRMRTFNIRQFRNNQATCSNIQVEEHINCTCSCPERHGHCIPPQTYDPEQCECKCPENVNRNCPNKKQFFEPKECKCKCKNYEKKCSTSSFLDETKCRCIKQKKK